MWKQLRILALLLVLLWAALHTWMDRYTSTRWQKPLWVGIFPVADGSARSQSYIDSLTPAQFADIEAFFSDEAHRYGRALQQPVHVELYPQLRKTPPQLQPHPGLLGAALWSLQLRWFGWRHAQTGGKAPPRIELFVIYHDPDTHPIAPDSHGLQKGLVGVVHAFATPAMNGSNNIVIAHELLHTLGATDKYDPRAGEPLFPSGFAEPERQPLYPQDKAEIMAGRRLLAPHTAVMPPSLLQVVVGPATALEIGWTRP